MKKVIIGKFSINYETNEDGTLVVRKFPSTLPDLDLVIPDEEDGMKVVAIKEGAFQGCNNLKSVTIGNNVKAIGDCAFKECGKLKSITIPSGVATIGSSIVAWCWSLEEIKVSANNPHFTAINGNLYSKDGKTLIQYAVGKRDTVFSTPAGLKIIGTDAFWSACNLTQINLKNGVEEISYGAFDGCRGIMEITIPASVKAIGSYAFARCPNLKAINVDDKNPNYASENGNLYDKGKTTLIQYTHNKTESRFVLPKSVTSVYYGAFMGMQNLAEIIVSPDNPYLKSIDGNLYTKDGKELVQYAVGKKATSFVIPSSVVKICDNAFYHSPYLTQVVIPEGVRTIGHNSFEFCRMGEVSIPSSVVEIGAFAFYGCDSIKKVTNRSELKIQKKGISHGYLGYNATEIINL